MPTVRNGLSSTLWIGHFRYAHILFFKKMVLYDFFEENSVTCLCLRLPTICASQNEWNQHFPWEYNWVVLSLTFPLSSDIGRRIDDTRCFQHLSASYFIEIGQPSLENLITYSSTNTEITSSGTACFGGAQYARLLIFTYILNTASLSWCELENKVFELRKIYLDEDDKPLIPFMLFEKRSWTIVFYCRAFPFLVLFFDKLLIAVWIKIWLFYLLRKMHCCIGMQH